MDSKDQPPNVKGAPTGLNLAELDTVIGKVFVDPFSVIFVYDHEAAPAMNMDGVQKTAKSTLMVQLGPCLRLAITAQEAYDILNESAKAIQATRGEE